MSGTSGVFAFSLPTYTQFINCACTSARGWSPDQRRLSTRHRMRYMNREAAFVAVAASAIVAACEELNRSNRVDDAASCIILWLYLPVSSRARMPSVKMTGFGFRMKMAMGKRYTRPFLLLLACHVLSNEFVLELSFSSMTSKDLIRKSRFYTRFSHKPTFYTKPLHNPVFKNVRIQSWSAKLISWLS